MPRGLSESELQAKENQKRLFLMIGAILALVVEFGLGGWGIHKVKEIQEGEGIDGKNINALVEELAATEESVRRHDEALLKYSKPVGWELTVLSATDPKGTHAHDPEALKQFLDAMLDKLTGEYGSPEHTTIHKQDLAKWAKWSQNPPDEKKFYLKNLYPILIELRGAYRRTSREHVTNAAARTGEEGTAWTGFISAAKTARGAIEAPATALGQKGRQLTESVRSHNTELRTARANELQAKEELAAVVAANDRRKRELDTKLEDLRRRIREAKHRQAEQEERREADGKVLTADETIRTAYLDMTFRDRVFPGTQFRVFRILKGGVREEKGIVEIAQVGERFTTARILPDINKRFPDIEAGDQVYNEFYERGRARHVAMAGDFRGPYSREDLVARLRSFGDIYQERIDEKTEMVIVGDGFQSDPTFSAAVDANLRILTEKYFYEYLGLAYTARRD